jgi:calcineurin-like phosphoesterase family protein
MDRQMIDWWNSVLRPEDEVWHLDDFAFRQRTRWTSVRKVKEGETTNDIFAFLTAEPSRFPTVR